MRTEFTRDLGTAVRRNGWSQVNSDAPKHSPGFRVDERYIKLCTRSMAAVALEFLTRQFWSKLCKKQRIYGFSAFFVLS